MKLKKIISKGILGAMVLMSVGSVGMIAEASNWGDKPFSGFYSGYNYVETGWRLKEDYSSAYVYNSGSPCGVYVNVWGRAITWDYYNGVPTNVQENVEMCNYNSSVLVGKGQAKKLLNTVKEKRKTECQLTLTGTEIRVNLSGLWSPDSI